MRPQGPHVGTTCGATKPPNQRDQKGRTWWQTGPHPDLKTFNNYTQQVRTTIPAPVYMQYVLSGFYQNHMWYMRSADELQLRSGDGSVRHQVEELEIKARSFCGKMTLTSPLEDRVLYPCGLVAATCFNDTFWVQVQKPGTTIFWVQTCAEPRYSVSTTPSGCRSYRNQVQIFKDTCFRCRSSSRNQV